jgi:hypothetical protein
MCTEQLITEVSKSVIGPLSGSKILITAWKGWSKTAEEMEAAINTVMESATDEVMEYAKQTCTEAGCEGIIWLNVAVELEELMKTMSLEEAVEQCKKNYNDGWWLG